ncbi:MAG: acyltransferase domain-containing protein [Burkholderiales bacterium]
MTVRWVAVASGQGGQQPGHAQRVATSPLGAAWRRATGSVVPGGADVAANRIAQPTIAAWQLDAFASLAPRVPAPVLVAGYSVGEVAACAIAGAFAPDDAIVLAAERARLMDEAAPYPCSLAAVLGLFERDVESLCQGREAAIAIRNGPRHFIVGGRREDVDRVVLEASAAGAARAHALAVATPAHTRWLAAAVPRFAQSLARVAPASLRIPMISAIDASRVATAAEVASALSRQIATRLDWAACMEAIAEMQPDAVMELGPCNALARMLAEAVPHVPVRAIEDFRDPAAAAAWILGQGR